MIKDIFKDSLFYGGAPFFSKLIGILLVPIYTRLFSVSEYGIIGLIAGVVGFIGIFMQAGSNNAVQRFYFDADGEDNKNRVLYAGLLITLGVSILVYLLSISFFYFIEDIVTTYSVTLSVLIVAITVQFVAQYSTYLKEVMRVVFDPIRYSMIEIFPVLLSALITIFLLMYWEVSLLMFYTGAVVGGVLGVILAIILVRRVFSFIGEQRLADLHDSKLTSEMFSFAYPFIFVGLSYWVFLTSDRFLLLWFLGKDEVGYYFIGTQVASALLMVTAAFGAAWSPYAMKILSEREDHKAIFSKVATMWMMVLTFVTVSVMLFSKEILLLLSTDQYTEAADVIPILLFSNFLLGTTQFTALGISISKKTSILSRYSWIVAVVNVVLNLILIPLIGLMGAAIATALCNLLLTTMYNYKSQSEYPISYEYGISIMLIAFVLIVMIGIISMDSLDTVSRLIMVLGMAAMSGYLLMKKARSFNLVVADR